MVKEDGFRSGVQAFVTMASLDVGVIRLLAIFCSIKLVDYMHSTSTIWKWERIMLVKSSQSNKVGNIYLSLVAGGYVNTWERTIFSPISCLDVEVDMERMWFPRKTHVSFSTK